MKTREVIWAASILDTSIETIENTKKFADQLYSKVGLSVVPVYVRENQLVNSSGHFPQVQKFFGSDLQVIENSGYTTESYAESLLDLVDKRNAEMIIVNTAGKSFAERFFLGSFCEYLVQNSKVPIAVVGPKCKPIDNLEHVLFPTDISTVSKQAFRKCIDLFAQMDIRVSLATELMQPETVMATAAMGTAWINIEPFPVEDVKRTKQQLEPLVTYAKDRGITVETSIETQLSSTAAAVRSLASVKRADLIVMATESGPISRSLFGSVGREVIHDSECPVMVYPMSDGLG